MNVRRVLVECVKDHDWSSSPPALERFAARQVPARLVASAFADRVAGCAYRSFSALAGTDEEALAGLGAGYRWALAAHLRAVADIKAVGDALDDGGIRWLVVKGPILADVYYPDPGLRTYFDLDLVVRPCDLRHAIEVLEAGGSTVVEQEWAATGRRLQVELKLILPNGSRGDLHWHLVTDESMRREVDLPMAEMFERARWTTVGPGVPARTLDAEDTLIHLALHGVASGGNRLVWLKDVEQAVLAEPDWGVVIDRAAPPAPVWSSEPCLPRRGVFSALPCRGWSSGVCRRPAHGPASLMQPDSSLDLIHPIRGRPIRPWCDRPGAPWYRVQASWRTGPGVSLAAGTAAVAERSRAVNTGNAGAALGVLRRS